jgi:cytochrome c oxidase cbb3-type subunit 2
LRRTSACYGILTAIVISIGGLVEIVPLYFTGQVGEAAPGVKPYTALQLEGRDIYLREGCYNCHSQMIRPYASRNRALWALFAGR